MLDNAEALQSLRLPWGNSWGYDQPHAVRFDSKLSPMVFCHSSSSVHPSDQRYSGEKSGSIVCHLHLGIGVAVYQAQCHPSGWKQCINNFYHFG